MKYGLALYALVLFSSTLHSDGAFSLELLGRGSQFTGFGLKTQSGATLSGSFSDGLTFFGPNDKVWRRHDLFHYTSRDFIHQADIKMQWPASEDAYRVIVLFKDQYYYDIDGDGMIDTRYSMRSGFRIRLPDGALVKVVDSRDAVSTAGSSETRSSYTFRDGNWMTDK